MPPHVDVARNREPLPCSDSHLFGRKERLKDLLSYIVRYALAVIPDHETYLSVSHTRPNLNSSPLTFMTITNRVRRIDDEIEFMLDSFGVEFPSEHEAYSHLNFIRDMEDYVLRVAANACRNLITANKRGERNDLA
mgnify:CR=1 FL=1